MVTDNVHTSEAYWRHEQDLLCDIVRQEAEVHGPGNAYPNVFITIAPAEWKFLLHSPIFQDHRVAQKLSGSGWLQDITGFEVCLLFVDSKDVCKGM